MPTQPSRLWNYVIDDIVLNNGKISISITQNFSEIGNKLVTAAYSDNGRLIALSVRDTAPVVEFEMNIEGAEYISAVIWNSTSGMKPLSENIKKAIPK